LQDDFLFLYYRFPSKEKLESSMNMS